MRLMEVEPRVVRRFVPRRKAVEIRHRAEMLSRKSTNDSASALSIFSEMEASAQESIVEVCG